MGFSYEPTQVKLSVDLKSRGSLHPVVRSVCWDNEQFRLLVGTLGNEIYELNANDGNNVHANEPLLQVRGGQEGGCCWAWVSAGGVVLVGPCMCALSRVCV